MIERIEYGTYHVVIPQQQSWGLYKHIRTIIQTAQKRHQELFLVVLYSDVKKHDMPDYYADELEGMAKLAKMPDVSYDHVIFIGEIPTWRKFVYVSASKVFPQFGRDVYFCDTLDEAMVIASYIREQYQKRAVSGDR